MPMSSHDHRDDPAGMPAGHDHPAHAGHAHHDHARPDHAGHEHGGHDHPAAAAHSHAGHSHAGHGHSHGAGGHAGHSHGSSSETRTAIAALITVSFMVVEAVGGVVSGSLALLADAAHMLTDAVALALAWWAFRMTRRPASPAMSYGHHRMTVLVAFANSVALLLLTAWIVVEAVERFADPVAIDAETMGLVALLGLGANVASFLVLAGGERNMNIRGAILHVLSDLLGSVGAVIAALVIWLTGWVPIDPILSLVVAGLLLRATLSLMRESAHVLLEGAPEGAEGPAIAADLAATVPGVAEAHHVHAWTLAEGRLNATLHVVVAEGAEPAPVVRKVKARLSERFGIAHATVEVERPGDCADGARAPG
jgi:cobalt-zinc-cadmium efflux system protein